MEIDEILLYIGVFSPIFLLVTYKLELSKVNSIKIIKFFCLLFSVGIIVLLLNMTNIIIYNPIVNNSIYIILGVLIIYVLPFINKEILKYKILKMLPLIPTFLVLIGFFSYLGSSVVWKPIYRLTGFDYKIFYEDEKYKLEKLETYFSGGGISEICLTKKAGILNYRIGHTIDLSQAN